MNASFPHLLSGDGGGEEGGAGEQLNNNDSEAPHVKSLYSYHAFLSMHVSLHHTLEKLNKSNQSKLFCRHSTIK
jgi:hypothetical protein